jgi:spore germination protein KA
MLAAEHIDAMIRLLPLGDAPPLAAVRDALHGDQDFKSADVVLRDGRHIAVAYIETLADEQRLWQEIVQPLVAGQLRVHELPRATPVPSWHELLQRLLHGYALLLPPDGPALAVDLRGLQQRAVESPSTERQVIGPKEGFVEKLETNVGLVRNRLRDPALRVQYIVLGRRSRTRVAMLYLKDVTRSDLVTRTRRGLRSVGVDFIRTAWDVVELTFQHGWSTFPLIEQTERPDRVAAALAQGRLALVVEGAPFALLAPATFFDFQKDGEGALPGPAISGFIRVLRLAGLFLSLTLPGLYVAVLGANPELLPTPLNLTLAATRIAIPYPVATETLLMLLVADILAEATTQAASSIGNALAIVGTLIVGQMMVQAQLGSSLMMIIIAASVMGAFMTLKYSFSYGIRIWKYALVLLAAVTGVFGWFTGLLLLLVHLASLESAGIPYLAPLAAARTPAGVAAAVVQPGRARMRLRPPELRPRQRVRARRGGRR